MAGGARRFIFFFLSRGARGGGEGLGVYDFFFFFVTILIYLHNRLTRKNRSFYKLGGEGGGEGALRL